MSDRMLFMIASIMYISPEIAITDDRALLIVTSSNLRWARAESFGRGWPWV